jgi:hypothetical protein
LTVDDHELADCQPVVVCGRVKVEQANLVPAVNTPSSPKYSTSMLFGMIHDPTAGCYRPGRSRRFWIGEIMIT